jgi:tRNA-2-methylthio-N6-dimethylallyladenosine synthase
MAVIDGFSSAAGPGVYLQTFGCQMNELDSELVRGHLTAMGYRLVPDPEAADVILYNTCSVREQAENKVLSRVGRVGISKREGSKVILGLIGCLAEREGRRLLDRYPQIDVLCGPGELDKLPMLLDNALKAEVVEAADRVALQGDQNRRTGTLEAAQDNLELLDLSRAFDPDRAQAGGRSAYVRITRGCNKFCTYCVVPYTRGAEVHRPPDAVVEECRQLADRGVLEVTLLGQTVNHYVYTHGVAVRVDGHERAQVGPGQVRPGTSTSATARVTTFADLLQRIHDEVPQIRRLRFVTSYPRDFGDDALAVMARSPRICRYLHVPAQSGSNRVLARMNRGYTVEQYLDFIDRARRFMPDVSIAGDLIVGFPGEDEADFQATKDLLQRVRFKNNFIFKYSPRPGTAAMKRLEDDIPEHVKRQRNNDLLALQSQISAQVHRELVGQHVEVFVEQISPKQPVRQGNVELGWAHRPIQLSGRTGGDHIAVFEVPGDTDPCRLIGQIVTVQVVSSGPLILVGRLAGDQVPQHEAAVASVE